MHRASQISQVLLDWIQNALALQLQTPPVSDAFVIQLEQGPSKVLQAKHSFCKHKLQVKSDLQPYEQLPSQVMQEVLKNVPNEQLSGHLSSLGQVEHPPTQAVVFHSSLKLVFALNVFRDQRNPWNPLDPEEAPSVREPESTNGELFVES